MRISTKIFIALALVAIVALFNVANWISSTLKPRYREAVEDSLVDLSYLIAATLELAESPERAAGEVMTKIREKRFKAEIYELLKHSSDIRLYLTDYQGKVLYHSHRPEDIGSNYSNWRDVHLTLKGEYGARTTRDNENDPNSTVLYVAAPIIKEGKLWGVVTVAKPTRLLNSFISRARQQIGIRFVITGIVVVLLGFVLSVGMTRPLKLLTDYARLVRDGKADGPPKLPRDEIGELGQAFNEMRIALEGKDYVEKYIQNLTHELKAPIAGIQGAIELLAENPPKESKEKFFENIRYELERMKNVVDQLLELSALEKRGALEKYDRIELSAVIAELVDSFAITAAKQRINLERTASKNAVVFGDPFLIRQAISNLIENALSFAKEKVKVELSMDEQSTTVSVSDDGPGVPDFAQERIFERFYSLPRPSNGKKSSGLGLSLVQEVMRLHNGLVTLERDNRTGATFKLSFPKVDS